MTSQTTTTPYDKNCQQANVPQEGSPIAGSGCILVASGSESKANTSLCPKSRLLLQRLLVEELTRERASDDYERYLETFRRATVDANPHQIEAVVFALNRLAHGGSLLCDEVGLGKTIEAGLVISEIRARGAERILIILPVALARQWQVEMEDLFSIPSTILDKQNFAEFEGRSGVYLIGRELAGSERRAPILRDKGPWDLIVVDEAHEMLSGLHQRFHKRTGAYQGNLKVGSAKRAGWLKFLLEGSPILLLTATPLQNNLFELWSLVHFLDQDSTVLGPFPEFAALYVAQKGRAVRPERLQSLKDRLSEVLCRSLRREVSPFLKVPFVKRSCETMDFSPPHGHSELYVAVTKWLSKPDMVLYHFQERPLTTIQVRRRMGSSPQALLYTINSMCRRASSMLADPAKRAKRPEHLLQRDLHDLEKLKKLAQKAVDEPDPKLALLRRVLHKVEERAKSTGGSDKLVVFTESKQTLLSIVAHLEKKGFAGQVTAFSGGNEGPRVEEALKRWMDEVGVHLSDEFMPGGEACRRAALLHEFRTRSRVLVATEAGAKGLNLQFCNCMVNYDLPWNPQRLEQRIGRVHRYGQTHDVVIFNFVNMANVAERRVYNLLKDKLHLFDGLFGASDEILGLTASINLEARIDEILRSSSELGQAFDALENDIEEQNARCAELRAASHKLLENLRPDVQARLRGIGETFSTSLSVYDEHLLELMKLEDPNLQVQESTEHGTTCITAGRTFRLGSSKTGESPHPRHPYIRSLIDAVRQASLGRCFSFQGKETGQWEVYLLRFQGLDSEERLLVLGEGDLKLALASARFLSESSLDERPDHLGLAEALEFHRQSVEARQQSRAQRRLRMLEGREADLNSFWAQEERELSARVEKARTAQRMACTAADMRQASEQVKKLKAALTTLQNQRRQRLVELRERLETEKDSLHEAKFIEHQVRRLFAVSIESEERES